jgi:hypothetical protein
MEASVNMTVFFDVTLCSLVEIQRDSEVFNASTVKSIELIKEAVG